MRIGQARPPWAFLGVEVPSDMISWNINPEGVDREGKKLSFVWGRESSFSWTFQRLGGSGTQEGLLSQVNCATATQLKFCEGQNEKLAMKSCTETGLARCRC